MSSDSTVPGEIISRYPTITCLAIEWLIEGDDDLDCRVEVSYRRSTENSWQEGMPLVRVPAGNTGYRTRPTYNWPNKFSGSIIDLRPDTEYEIRLSLLDPDGGEMVETVTAHTRPVPAPAENFRTVTVNPLTLNNAAMSARPGDIIVLSPGYYGEFTCPRDGQPGRPIVFRASDEHRVIGSVFDEVNLEHRRHIIIDGLTVMGPVNLRWAEDVSVRYCEINSKYGIIAKRQPGCKNCYIADNTISYVMPWVAEGIGAASIWNGPANVGEGIEITGPGNVICYNRVTGFRDCISTMEDLWMYDQFCIDIYNNDIRRGPDDGIEADFCMNNVRIMRNRISNCGMGLSSQPALGGPVYFIRNVMYNIAMAPFKLERLSYGNLFLHNTVVKSGDGLFEHHGQNEFFRTLWRNNLSIGGGKGGKNGRYSSGEGRAVMLPGYNATCDFSFNAVGAYEAPFTGMLAGRKFASIEELNELTSGHNVQIGIEVFANEVDFPEPVFPEREPADLQIAPGSPAEDAAVLIPNINENFTGKAPDIGAYEVGQEIPHYGPRPRGLDENTRW